MKKLLLAVILVTLSPIATAGGYDGKNITNQEVIASFEDAQQFLLNQKSLIIQGLDVLRATAGKVKAAKDKNPNHIGLPAEAEQIFPVTIPGEKGKVTSENYDSMLANYESAFKDLPLMVNQLGCEIDLLKNTQVKKEKELAEGKVKAIPAFYSYAVGAKGSIFKSCQKTGFGIGPGFGGMGFSQIAEVQERMRAFQNTFAILRP